MVLLHMGKSALESINTILMPDLLFAILASFVLGDSTMKQFLLLVTCTSLGYGSFVNTVNQIPNDLTQNFIDELAHPWFSLHFRPSSSHTSTASEGPLSPPKTCSRVPTMPICGEQHLAVLSFPAGSHFVPDNKVATWRLPDFKIVFVWPFGLLDYGIATLRCKI